MTQYNLKFLDWFDDDEELVEQKGWHTAQLELEGRIIELAFYDPLRLSQDIACEIANHGFFVEEKKIIVIDKVTREEMEKAVSKAIVYLR